MPLTLRLLLIDDDELDRLAVMRALKQSSLQFEIVQSASAAEGLAIARAQRFDAILLDYRLPDMDGVEVLRKLRSDQFISTTVIMISRFEDDAIAEICLDAGAQDFLLKDEVAGRSLTRAIRQAKQRHQIAQTLRETQEQLRTLTERDPLTGLINRRGFELALSGALARAHRDRAVLAVLLLDLDDFKSVNDTLGHDAGDVLLVEIARRLGAQVRDGDCLCRLGGDEFVVLAINMEQSAQADLLAARLLSVFRTPIMVGGAELVITGSIGIAVIDEVTTNEVDLLKHADIAMYRAKAEGRNQSCFYSEDLHNTVRYHSRIRSDLQKALARNELQVYYQAQIRAADGRLGGMEALVRWHHPEMGVLLPGTFIEVAEQAGLIVEVGAWVLQQACCQLKDWQMRWPEQGATLVMGVNVSASQLRDEALAQTVAAALADSGLDAGALELEITETALIADPEATVLTLASLVDLGLTMSLDDFGTGYSSLLHLKLFPIRVLKIDRAFVATIGKDPDSDRLLMAMIRFAQTLALKIVAEGVETEEQAQFCRVNGCDLLQGFHYSRPVPAAQFEAAFFAGNRSCGAGPRSAPQLNA